MDFDLEDIEDIIKDDYKSRDRGLMFIFISSVE